MNVLILPGGDIAPISHMAALANHDATGLIFSCSMLLDWLGRRRNRSDMLNAVKYAVFLDQS
jgi:hypothetical protein